MYFPFPRIDPVPSAAGYEGTQTNGMKLSLTTISEKACSCPGS